MPMQISRIRLSDKTSRLHPRHVVPKPAQAYEPEVPVHAAAAKSLERQSQAMEKEVRFFQVDAANRGETPHRAAA